MTAKNGTAKLVDMELLGSRDERRLTIIQVLMPLLGFTMLMSTVMLLQSLKNDPAGGWPNTFTTRGFSPRTAENDEYNSSGKMTAEIKDYTPNDETWLLRQVQENGTSPCHHSSTTQVLLAGLELPSKGNFRLATNQDHHVVLVAFDKSGTRRCNGGDFFETDLSGENWKSRPPTKDMGDGSYQVNLRVEGRMAGVYTFKVILLFGNFHGLDLSPEPWIQAKEVLTIKIDFLDLPRAQLTHDPHQSKLLMCTPEEFRLGAWHGRWTRTKANESCSFDEEGRLRCLDPDESCVQPWCDGPLGRLESNGWVYSAHCAFKIFTQDEAWRCLRGRWLFFWGDSNHQDTIRNLLNFILGFKEYDVWRSFLKSYTNPANASETVQITSVFNGHYVESNNNRGLGSLTDFEYRTKLRSAFLDSKRPDTIILNSGLHDGKFWPNLQHFAKGARNASKFWEDIWKKAGNDSSTRPQLLFRTTVAPAGISRNMPSNPQKMEVYNTVLGEELMSIFGKNTLKVVDAYDMTFPWHYDNKYSDGGHYGRSPGNNNFYFVDVMLAHILLNTICPI